MKSMAQQEPRAKTPTHCQTLCVSFSKRSSKCSTLAIYVSARYNTMCAFAAAHAGAASACAAARTLQQRRPRAAAARTRVLRTAASSHAGSAVTTLPAPAHAATPALRRSPSAEELVLQYNKVRKLGDGPRFWGAQQGLLGPPPGLCQALQAVGGRSLRAVAVAEAVWPPSPLVAVHPARRRRFLSPPPSPLFRFPLSAGSTSGCWDSQLGLVRSPAAAAGTLEHAQSGRASTVPPLLFPFTQDMAERMGWSNLDNPYEYHFDRPI